MKTTLPLLAIATAVALGASACSSAAPADSPTFIEPTVNVSASPTQEAPVGFAITSPDFAEGDNMADWATANAFGGQCTGDNLNPALQWQELPEGTVSVAITMLDASAGNFVHWIHTDIPVEVTSVERGASAELAGVQGRNQGDSANGYFGPCPPGPNHRYIFTVWALDAPTGLEPGFSYYDWLTATTDHVLGKAELTGSHPGAA